jgi:hypothetical protein
MMKLQMNPDEFAAKMREIATGVDPEGSHADADNLMCELLMSLGYSEGITVFLEMGKWYA